ncbi:MAG: hypothetical protein JWM02_3645 [Frankiales bacterium]|nr:hypothetical protein [Frankiales bacterium]
MTRTPMSGTLNERARVQLWGGWTLELPPCQYERKDGGPWSAWGDDWTVNIHIIEVAGDSAGKPLSAEKMLSASDRGKQISGSGWIGRAEIVVERVDDRDVYRLGGRLAAENTLMSCWVSYVQKEQHAFAEELIGGVAHLPGDVQRMTALTAEDEDRLAEQRTTLEQYLGDERSKESYKTAAGKLALLHALVEQRIFQRTQTYELQSMGVIMGDTFVQELGMEWVLVEDSYGRDAAVRVPGTSILIYPLTLISKRIEKGEQIDVFDLFNGIAHEVETLKKQGA